MGSRILFGILLGATIGLAVGHFGQRAGGTCPLTCNPYGGAIVGALFGALVAGALGQRTPSYTPSPHLVSLGSVDAFEEKVLQAEGPVLVEFYTTNCGFCRKLEPVIHSLADRYAGRAVIAQVNTADVPELSKRYGIRGVPAMILFKDGQPVAQTTGYQPEEDLAAFLQPHLPAETEEKSDETPDPTD